MTHEDALEDRIMLLRAALVAIIESASAQAWPTDLETAVGIARKALDRDARTLEEDRGRWGQDDREVEA